MASSDPTSPQPSKRDGEARQGESALRRWKQALRVALLLGAILGGLVWFLRPHLYTSAVLVRVPLTEQKILPEGAEANWLPSEANQFQNSQVALITCRPVLREALRDEQIRRLALIQKQADPIDWLERHLKAELVVNTDILRLELSSREHPEDLKHIVNAIQKAYMKEIVAGERNQQLALLKDMEDIYAKAQGKIRQQRENLHRLAESLKTGDSQIMTIKQKNLLEEYAAMKKEVAGLDAKLRDTTVKLAVQKHRVQKLRVNDSHAREVNQEMLHARDVEEEVLTELKVLQEQRKELLEQANKLGRDVDSIGVQSTELELMRNEIEQAELVVKALGNKKARLQVELSSENKHRVFLVAPADEATVLEKSRRYLEAGGAALVGMFLGLVGISIGKFRSRRLYTAVPGKGAAAAR